MKEQKSIRNFWYYNQWQECYEELKKSLGKSIRFERGVPELSEDLCEINLRYNNIIILDDSMAGATDSPVVFRLFTQGRHRNASVTLLLQNMFPKGKYNTDISRNAQCLALFRSPSDRKQIGIIGERMFVEELLENVWQNTLGAQAVRKIPERYVIIEMYNTSLNERHQPVRGGVLINDENYWPVKLKHRGSDHIKCVNLHSNEPTVQSIIKETMENHYEY